MFLSRNDIDIVAKCIKQRYGNKLPASRVTMSNYGWSHPVLNLIDCILSLNRDYYQFAKPRVIDFKKKHRDVVTLQQLKNLILNNGGPSAFFKKELSYNDPNRARVLWDVLNQLIKIAEQFPGINESRKIGKWAHSASPANYKDFGIFGFGLAGFQYLRMLFGVDTVKPDRWIKDFVKDCLGNGVSDMRALCLVEAAAKSAGYSPRQVDSVIWEEYAGKGASNHPKRKKRC